MTHVERVLCKFTETLSLMADGERFWIVGIPTNEWFDLSNHRDHPDHPDPIIAAVNLSDGLVHLLTHYGAVYAVQFNAETTFVITKLRN